MPVFTTDDLLLYLYNDLGPLQRTTLESALEKDWALREKLEVLKSSIHKMNKAASLQSPRPKTIEALLHYADADFHVSH